MTNGCCSGDAGAAVAWPRGAVSSAAGSSLEEQTAEVAGTLLGDSGAIAELDWSSVAGSASNQDGQLCGPTLANTAMANPKQTFVAAMRVKNRIRMSVLSMLANLLQERALQL